MEILRKKLSAQEILEKEFKKKMKGYDPQEVDEFLDEVLYTIEQLEEENERLKGGAAKPADAATQEMQSKTEDLVEQAEETARQILKETNENARMIVESAEVRLEKIKREVAEYEGQIRDYKKRLCEFMQEQRQILEAKLGPLAQVTDGQQEYEKSKAETIGEILEALPEEPRKFRSANTKED